MREPSSSEMPLKENPTTIETTIPLDNAESCRRKYNSLREAQKLHKLNDINYRLEILKKLLVLWDKYAEEVALSNYLDLGITESGNTISNYCIIKNEILYAINNLKDWVKPRYVDVPLFLATSNCYVKPEPYGLVLIFSAWNCNFLTLLVPLVQAIAAGNCVIAKPASTAKETCKVCLKILNELPHDVVYGCAGKPDVYTELLSQRWDLIIFTGSAAKGKLIAEKAAPNLTPTILELGGQNPVIVEKSADLKLAAYNIVFGRHMFTGQACIAPEYIMVDKTIKDKLIVELKNTFDTFYTKNPEKSPELGIIVNSHYAERIKGLVENPGEGAQLLYGDLSKINLEKKFIPPFLFGFDNFEQMKKSKLAEAEIFGPVLYLCPYDRIEEAINYMNGREKPLSGYLFTKDNSIKELVRDNTSSGCLDINDTLVHFSSPYLPFGGVGNSGMSAYHGKWGFDNMSHLKPVVDQANILFPFRYPPYSKSSLKLMRYLIPHQYNRRHAIRCCFMLILIVVFLIFVLPKFLCKK
jgi:aldehyde dehydrogenase (NAD+)